MLPRDLLKSGFAGVAVLAAALTPLQTKARFQPACELRGGCSSGAIVGHGWAFAGGQYGLTAALNLGAEINVHTDGAGASEGAIVLGGLALTFKS